ncbi:MAG: MMPL family transporter [Actinobacteria bacterium]|nr:MAG: MMPL family transporter [Actinomycetota bacterium]
MLGRLARFTVKRRRMVLLASLVALVAAGAFGGSVFSNLKNGGFTDPGSESERAKAILERTFHAGEPNLVLLVTARQGSVDDPAVAQAGVALTRRLAGERGIDQAFSYWTLGSPQPLRSKDGLEAMVLARIGGDDETVRNRVEELSPRYTRTDGTGPITVQVGGQAEVFRQVGSQVEQDLRKAETITFPVVLLLLVLVFGSLIAAGMPLAVGAFAVVGTFLALNLLTRLTNVSIFSINLTTALGIGLGIDYSLFIVSRFREELRGGLGVSDAVVRTVQTAGRTVLFSALTVAISLAALMIFPLYFLRSFAYAGIAVVALATAAAIVSLPALLAVVGTRIDRFVLFRRRAKEVGEGFWHRLATSVMGRPIPYAVAVIAVLLILGAPFLGVKFGQPDDRVLPASASSRQVQDQIRTNFPSQEAAALEVVAPTAGPPSATRDSAVQAYAIRLSSLPGAARVDALTGSYIAGRQVAGPNPASVRFSNPSGTWLSVVPSVEPQSPAGERLVKAVRATPAPFAVLVTGPSAQLVDSKASIGGRLPLAALIIALTTFVILFLMTGSVVVPLKAIVLNVLSLSATFGAMVWIFQEGHLASSLGFTPTGTIDSTSPVLMFCIAFGLSMDYEVFLLSRIKEEYDRTGENTRSVAVGLERTGRIVTAAAALLSVVFIAFATSSITFIKMFGIGMALAVIMDATLIRGVLVPAFMRLAGRANWWAPGWLRRIHERVGISEVEHGALVIPEGQPALVPETVGGSDR